MAVGGLDAELRAAGAKLIGGVDEVGRGAFAGPLVAAAVILPEDDGLEGLDDSKRVPVPERERLAALIAERAVAMVVIEVAPSEIDARGLHRSNLWALHEAAVRLDPVPDHLVVDGYQIAPTPFATTVIPEADRASRVVAAASIVAKVHRDEIMRQLDAEFPGYGLADNKGYGTSEHRAVIDSLGPCPAHRLTFGAVGQPSLWSTA
ncbi:MAG: ribonuclease HII [Actinomycetota bacterium]